MDFLVLTQLAAACTAECGILAAFINPALNTAGLIIFGRLPVGCVNSLTLKAIAICKVKFLAFNNEAKASLEYSWLAASYRGN